MKAMDTPYLAPGIRQLAARFPLSVEKVREKVREKARSYVPPPR